MCLNRALSKKMKTQRTLIKYLLCFSVHMGNASIKYDNSSAPFPELINSHLSASALQEDTCSIFCVTNQPQEGSHSLSSVPSQKVEEKNIGIFFPERITTCCWGCVEHEEITNRCRCGYGCCESGDARISCCMGKVCLMQKEPEHLIICCGLLWSKKE